MRSDGQGAKRADTSSATPPTMRAIVQEEYGSADVLHLATTAVPAISDDEVLLRVHAAGLDRGRWHLMTGKPYLMRLMGFGVRRPKDPVQGIDAAGTVVAVGSSVTRFSLGDEVYGIARGSFAEYAVARADKLAPKPDRLSFEQAAVVPVSGLTAMQALYDVGKVEAGQDVLVLGASGGVGTYAVQLAKAAGAAVTAVCSAPKLDLVRSLGADHLLDYAVDDFADGARRYDLILDIGGNASVPRLRRALRPTGTVVFVGGEDGGSLTGGMSRQLRGMAVSAFSRQKLAMFLAKERGSDLERLTVLIDSGAVTPSIGRTYPLEQVPAAMRHLVAGTVRGKVAITV